MQQQVVRLAIQRTRRHDVRSRAHQRGLSARRADRARVAFQRRDAFFEDGGGPIRDARVHVPRTLLLNERGGVVRVAEGERRGLINGRGTCAGHGIGRGARVQRASVSKRLAGIVARRARKG